MFKTRFEELLSEIIKKSRCVKSGEWSGPILERQKFKRLNNSSNFFFRE